MTCLSRKCHAERFVGRGWSPMVKLSGLAVIVVVIVIVIVIVVVIGDSTSLVDRSSP